MDEEQDRASVGRAAAVLVGVVRAGGIRDRQSARERAGEGRDGEADRYEEATLPKTEQ